jgi:hypothetical protein
MYYESVPQTISFSVDNSKRLGISTNQIELFTGLTNLHQPFTMRILTANQTITAGSYQVIDYTTPLFASNNTSRNPIYLSRTLTINEAGNYLIILIKLLQ